VSTVQVLAGEDQLDSPLGDTCLHADWTRKRFDDIEDRRGRRRASGELLGLISASVTAPLIVAHRGASQGAQDNSLEAFENAIAVGADMIEFDVRRTRDDVLIAFQDRAVAGRPVGELTHAEMTETLGREPPTLDQVLTVTRGRVKLDVEFKEAGYVPRVLAALGTHFDPEEVVITSFLDTVVAEVKAAALPIETGLLFGVAVPERPRVRTRLSELFPVERARRCGADYVAPHVALARLGAVERASAAGYRSLVWTVNDDAGLRRYLNDDRLLGVITDVPAKAVALRDRGPPCPA